MCEFVCVGQGDLINLVFTCKVDNYICLARIPESSSGSHISLNLDFNSSTKEHSPISLLT